jgi:hypothetical protein
MANPADEAAAHKPAERFDYTPIIDRPRLALPQGKRIVVWPVANVEEWDVTKPMPRTVSSPPGGQIFLPDIPNWTWHEYGMRVGIWRLLDVFARLAITPSVCLNAKVIETRPRLAHAMKDAGWEFIAHCYEQMHIAKIEDQRAMMRQTLAIMTPFLGNAPSGWLGPGRGQTFATMDYIAEAGFTWFADYVMDDLPVWCATRHGPLLAMPYTSEMNDIPVMVGAQHESHVFRDRCKLAFDTLLREAVAQDTARVLCVSVHPYVSGAAHRIGLLEEMLAWLKSHPAVALMTGEEIYAWYAGQVPAPKEA